MNISLHLCVILPIEPNNIWKSISSAGQVHIIRKFKEHVWLHYTVDEWWVPAFVSPAEMGNGVDDIDTMVDWYHLIT